MPISQLGDGWRWVGTPFNGCFFGKIKLGNGGLLSNEPF